MATRKHAIYRRLDTPPGDAARQSCYLTGSGGACVDTGADPGVVGAMQLVPMFHYVHPMLSEVRVAVGTLPAIPFEVAAK